MDTKTVYITKKLTETGDYILETDASFENTDLDVIDVVITGESNSPDLRRFRVYYQTAPNYGRYSEYMKRHGCACCSLTTALTGYSDKYRELKPEQTVDIVEAGHFAKASYMLNYKKPMMLQMPVSLYGISRILALEGIRNRYVGDFSDKAASADIRTHLLSGMPVIVETSRMRRENGIVVDKNDKKYAGSYHTQILLGMTEAGKVIFTDSANRVWSGTRQRLKMSELDDIIKYMFPQKNTDDAHPYFSHRSNTGGYILIDEAL
ncbi:MAG: hypothetical protein IIY88_07055 [Eubacterium sp.]|nr:hypothetical protein [Eubacterium sp.]